MGNHQETYPGVVNFPAGFNNVIAVGATDNADVIAGFSVQGNNIDVAAPGVDILSTLINNGYVTESGTSMASPHVAGIASLLKGFNTALANDDIENIIEISADNVAGMNGQAFTTEYGHGRVNAAQALGLLQAPNSVNQFTVTGGTVVSTTGNYTNVFYATPGLAPGAYVVNRYEVIKSVTFPYSFCNIVGAWGRGVGTAGYSVANPNYGEGFCEVVPGTLTNTGATLRTYVYEVYNILGQSMGFYPTTPSNVTFAYTVLGQANNYSISGPDNFCTSGTYTINLPTGATVSWSVSPSGIVSTSPSGNSVTLTKITDGSVTLTANVTSACGNTTISKPVSVGLQTLSVSSYVDRTPQWNDYQYLTATAVQLPGTVPGDYNWYEEVNGIRGAWLATGLQLSNYPIPPCTTVYYQCVATTSCGEAVYRGYAYNTSCGGYAVSNSLVAYPNPASTELNIDNTEEAGVKEGTPKDGSNPEFLVRLYNEKGNILRSAKNPKGSKGLKLDITEVPNGTYYLHISKGKEVSKKQIIIQH